MPIKYSAVLFSLPTLPIKRFLGRGFSPRVVFRDHKPTWKEDQSFERALRHARVTPEKIMKVRGSRAVILGRHPVYGRCVLKAACGVQSASLAHSFRSVAQVGNSSNNGIFPEIYEVGLFHRIEEYVEGSIFADWMKKGFKESSVVRFFDLLRSWSSSFEDLEGETLRCEELQGLAMACVSKYLSHYRYRARKNKVLAAISIRSQHRDLRNSWDKLSKTSLRVSLPGTMMCGDMGIYNLVVQNTSGSIYDIDYEEMSLGHWGFDAACFIASVFEERGGEAIGSRLAETLLTDEYLGGRDSGDFFRELASLLIKIARIVRDPAEVSQFHVKELTPCLNEL
jgi:hypothetical protein